MFETLPTELQYYFAPGASVYMPRRTTPAMVRGYGYITLLFESTNQPEVLSVGLRDVRLRLVPCAFPIDVDQDGQLESIELTNVELDATCFDLGACKGTLNRQTGDFELTFEYVISPNQVPLLGRFGGQTVRFSVTDRGKMDLRDGSFEIHSGVLEITDGPLAGARIRGGGSGTLSGPPPSTVELHVVIAVPGTQDCRDIKQGSVIICPGDQVFLCWTASADVVSVDIDPGGYTGLPPIGLLAISPVEPAPPAPQQVVYRVRTNGGTTPGTEDSVIVQFYRDGDWVGPFLANPSGSSWSIEIDPRSVSGRIVVGGIQILSDPGCLRWERFFLEHTPAQPPAGPGGPPDFGNNINGSAPVPIPTPFPAAGSWSFFSLADPPNPTPNSQESRNNVCFRFRGECR